MWESSGWESFRQREDRALERGQLEDHCNTPHSLPDLTEFLLENAFCFNAAISTSLPQIKTFLLKAYCVLDLLCAE